MSSRWFELFEFVFFKRAFLSCIAHSFKFRVKGQLEQFLGEICELGITSEGIWANPLDVAGSQMRHHKANKL